MSSADQNESTNFFGRYYAVLLLGIIAIAFFTRFFRLDVPPTYYFDEVYHAVTAKLIANNDPRAYEWSNPPPEPDTAVDWLHPPYAKLMQASSMLFFGQNSFGWRFSSAVAGILLVLVVAWLGRLVSKDHRVSLVAALFASTEGLLIVMSRIAMNDIHVTIFIALIAGCTIKWTQTHKEYWFWLASIAAGLALGTKWSGLFGLGILWGVTILMALKAILAEPTKRYILKVLAQFVIQLVIGGFVIPLVLYAASYSQAYFWQGKPLTHFKELHDQIIWYQTTLTATHPYQSRPLEWAFNLRPVYMHVDHSQGPELVQNVYAVGHPLLMILGLSAAVAATLVLLYQLIIDLITKDHSILKKLESFINTAITPLAILTYFYWAVWAPWFFAPRPMFYYHYTPAVPFLCLILAQRLISVTSKRWGSQIVIAVICLSLAISVIWLPHWLALPVSAKFADSIYFALESWR